MDFVAASGQDGCMLAALKYDYQKCETGTKSWSTG